MSQSADARDDRIEELLALCIEALETDGADAADAICARHPEFSDRLQREMTRLRELGLVEVAASSSSQRTIGDYRLLRELGHGGTGRVWLAQQISLRRTVALKLLRHVAAGSDEPGRLRREARILAGLRHPNIVRVLDVGVDQDVPYLAMEYVAGRSLDEVIHDAAADGALIDVDSALRWCADIADALQAAHEHGVYHRDLKPGNVLITMDRGAVLLDFGLASTAQEIDDAPAEMLRGTVRYLAPELLEGPATAARPELPHARADTYALGLTLYEAIAGRPAIHGDTTEQILHAIASPRATLPPTARDRVSRDLEIVLRTATEKDPRRRYGSAAAFGADLRALLEHRPIDARAPGTMRRLQLATRRHPARAVAIGVVCASALGWLLWLGVAAFAEHRANRREADAALQRAHAALDELRAVGVTIEAELEVMRALREDMRSRRLDHAENERLDVGERALTERHRLREQLCAAALEAAAAARASGAASDARALRRAVFASRWLQAQQESDASAERLYRALALAEAADSSEVALPRGRVELRGCGGLGYSLYRFEDLADAQDGGVPRRVPIPVDDSGRPLPLRHPFGSTTHALRLPSQVGELLAEATILSIGHDGPVHGALYATRSAAPIEPLDRLLTIDGEPVLDHESVRQAMRSDLPSQPHEFVFVRFDGLRITVEVAGAAAFGLGDAREIVARASPTFRVKARVWQQGRVQHVDLPAGLQPLPTAAPLPIGIDRTAGAELELDLPSGAYLALLRNPAGAAQRLPFRIRAAQTTRLEVTQPLVHLDGFVRCTPPHDTALEPFWIQAREVTFGEYLEFLEDPTVGDAIGSGNALRLVPRIGNRPLLTRDAAGSFVLPDGFRNSFPVVAISHADVVAYLEWRNRRSSNSGSDLRFALPDEAQWRHAATAPGDRLYPFGSTVFPKWFKCLHARQRAGLESTLAYPVDASAYGVHDMMGSLAEMGAGRAKADDTFAIGYSHRSTQQDGRILRGVLGAFPRADTGFRLVASRVSR